MACGFRRPCPPERPAALLGAGGVELGQLPWPEEHFLDLRSFLSFLWCFLSFLWCLWCFLSLHFSFLPDFPDASGFPDLPAPACVPPPPPPPAPAFVPPPFPLPFAPELAAGAGSAAGAAAGSAAGAAWAGAFDPLAGFAGLVAGGE